MPEQSPTRFTMVPARRSSEPTARRRARRIIGALFLASALSVVAVVIALGKRSSGADPAAGDPQGRDLAYTVAVNYLAGNELNVPHARSFDPKEAADPGVGRAGTPLAHRSLNWVGFSPQHFGSKATGFTDFELHHFLVVLDKSAEGSGARARSAAPTSPRPTASRRSPTAPAGGPETPTRAPAAPTPDDSPTGEPGLSDSAAPAAEVVQLDVSILLTGQGPRLAAVPAFSAWQGGNGADAGEGDYSNFSSLTTEVSEPVKSQIAQWARAYVNGDSAALLAVTGDQNTNHHYRGISGFGLPDSDQAVQTLSAIEVAGGQLVVRVRLLIMRADPGGAAPAEAGGQDDGSRFSSYADFDLLVGAPTGAQPPILAWGPAGSAAKLEAYSNALTE